MAEICHKSLVVKWIECRITEQEIRGSGPGSSPGKVWEKKWYICVYSGEGIVRGMEEY